MCRRPRRCSASGEVQLDASKQQRSSLPHEELGGGFGGCVGVAEGLGLCAASGAPTARVRKGRRRRREWAVLKSISYGSTNTGNAGCWIRDKDPHPCADRGTSAFIRLLHASNGAAYSHQPSIISNSAISALGQLSPRTRMRTKSWCVFLYQLPGGREICNNMISLTAEATIRKPCHGQACSMSFKLVFMTTLLEVCYGDPSRGEKEAKYAKSNSITGEGPQGHYSSVITWERMQSTLSQADI